MSPPRGGRHAVPACSAQDVARPRLYARLGSRPVVAVIGPAGYGKSVSVSSWLFNRADAGAVAWLTLDPSDGDPGRLAADLLASLRLASPALRDLFSELEAPPAFSEPLSLVDSLHEKLFDSEVPLTVVLDDVDQVSGSSRALEMLDHFLLWAPPSTRVVLTARSMPGLRLQRLRLEDRLALLGVEELAFTLSETSAAVRLWGLDLGSDSVEELHELTRGWPAAVRMALLAKREGGGRSRPAELLEDEALADYLATEVLNALDVETRQFVIDATVDERVCPSLLDAVRVADDSVTLLDSCVRRGLFLVREPATEAGQWFRWHGLFAAQMRARRRERIARSDVLERRAAQWWREKDPALAVTHALAGHDDELAGQVAARDWLQLVLRGRAETAHRIAAQALAQMPNSAAELHLARAFVAAEGGAIDSAHAALATARDGAGTLDGPARTGFEIRATMIELFMLRDRAALADSLACARKLMDQAESGDTAVDSATMALVKLCVGIGEARLLQDPLEALRLLREAESTARDAGYPALELMAQAEQCIPSVALGRIEETRLLAEQVLATARAKGWGDHPAVATTYAWLGWLALCQGEPRKGRDLMERCLADMIPQDWGLRGLITFYHAQACISLGDLDAAEEDVRKGGALAEDGRMPPWWPSVLAAAECSVLVAAGKVDQALDRLAAPPGGPEYYLATCYNANVLLQADRVEETLATLEDFPPHRMYPHVAGLVDALRAQALLETGDRTGAHAALERALLNAETHKFIQPFLQIGDRIAPLLGQHLREGTSHPDILIQVTNRLATPSCQPINQWGERLTPREQSVLRYLATNLSFAEVAEAECISVNTVKSHVSHVYQKLGVDSRRAAVRRSSELGLYPLRTPSHGHAPRR